MARVFKLPVALTILDRKTHLPLSLKVKLDASAARQFRGSIAQLVPRGAMLTIEELLDAMLIDSDNTADALLGPSAGHAGVTARLRALGIDGIRVDRSEGEIALDYASVTDVPPKDQWTLDWFQRAMSAVPRDQQRAAAQRFLADERDTATPDAMLALLRLLVQGKALSKDRTELVLDRMRRTIPGSERIKAGLPEGTAVAHRPGTGGENEGVSLCTNDAGIVDLPGGGHIIIAIFVKRVDEGDPGARSRHCWDHASHLRRLGALITFVPAWPEGW